MAINLHGRFQIYTTSTDITAENVVRVLNDALAWHVLNLEAEDYLYWYRRGIQPILARKKEVRPEICNKVVVNTAEQVVTFKNGYFLTKPAFYISRKDDDSVTDKVKELNEYLYASGKGYVDNLTVDWFHTVGVGVIYVEPNDDDDVPVLVHSIDPRKAFVVYSAGADGKPVMGVHCAVVNGQMMFDVYTKDNVFRVSGGTLEGAIVEANMYRTPFVGTAIDVVAVEPNVLGEIPIIEYVYKTNRMGAFEAALPLMDTYNLVESNRVDGVEQFIQSLFVGTNIQLPEGEDANTIRQRGMILFDSVGENKAEVKILSQELNQTQTQTTLDSLYEQILEKCGVPSTVGRDYGSTSDNVGAVYLRNGWAVADTDARNETDNFLESNKQFDRIFIRILKKRKGFTLNEGDFQLRIERNDMNNLLVKTQAAINMRDLGLAPQIWLERSGLSNDPLKDIELSKDYLESAEPAPAADAVMSGDGGEGSGAQVERANENGRSTGEYVRGYWR